MERKYITKGDISKLLVENGLVPYNDGGAEQADQYTHNEAFTKTLFSELHDVEWESKKVPDNGHRYYEGRLSVDWGIQFHFENGVFTFKPFVTSVNGTLRVYEYGEDGKKIQQDYPFNSKGFKINFEDINKNGSLAITRAEVNIDTKSIELMNFHGSYDPSYNPAEHW